MAKLSEKLSIQGLLSGIRFEGLKETYKFSKSLVISKIDGDQIIKGLVCEDTLSTWNRGDLRNCSYAIEFPLEADRNIDPPIANIYDFMTVLRVVKPILASPQFIISHFPEYDKPYFINKINPAKSCFSYDEDNIELCKFPMDYFKLVDTIWRKLPKIKEKKDRLWHTFVLYARAYYESIAEIRVLLFAIALESLFSIADQELSFGIALRTSRFLFEDFKSRKKWYREVKRAYGIRSQIVHGLQYVERNKHGQFKKKDPEQIKKELIFAESSLRTVVQKSLKLILANNTYIDIFDNPKQYATYMNKLVLNSDANKIK